MLPARHHFGTHMTQLYTVTHNCHKFNYLNSLLEERSIKGLRLTESNYSSAIDLLKERFGRTQKIIDAHADKLMKIPTCPIYKPHMLKSVYDQINVHIRLRKLSLTSVVLIIMSVMWNSELLERAERSMEGTCSNECYKKKEKLVRVSGPNPRSSLMLIMLATPLTTGTFVTHGSSIQCVYCQGHHYSAACNKVKARKNILLKNGCCFNCLKANHKLKDCRSPKTCCNCHQRHHQSICTSGLSAEAEPFVPQSKPKEPVTAEGIKNTQCSYYLSNATDTRQFKGGILWQTTQAIALDETGTWQAPVRILFDCGNQRSYATENLCSKLELSTIRSERLHLHTFGMLTIKLGIVSHTNSVYPNLVH